MFCGGGFELSVVFRACFGVLFWMLALRPQVRTVAPTGANRRGGLSPSISLSAASWSYRYGDVVVWWSFIPSNTLDRLAGSADNG